jgi:hypothetical protein
MLSCWFSRRCFRRVVVRAKQIGFAEIEAQGFDIADAQLHRARAQSRSVAEMAGVNLSFQHGDIRKSLPYPSNDLCLCLYGVLNHIAVNEILDALRGIAEVTTGYLWRQHAPLAARPPSMSTMSVRRCVSIRTTRSIVWTWNSAMATAPAFNRISFPVLNCRGWRQPLSRWRKSKGLIFSISGLRPTTAGTHPQRCRLRGFPRSWSRGRAILPRSRLYRPCRASSAGCAQPQGDAQMTDLLNSPFTIGFCLVVLVAWITMVCAIFWPGKGGREDDGEPRLLF